MATSNKPRRHQQKEQRSDPRMKKCSFCGEVGSGTGTQYIDFRRTYRSDRNFLKQH
jgi:hypothetical protein